MLVNRCVEEYLRRTNQLSLGRKRLNFNRIYLLILVTGQLSDDDVPYINRSVLTQQGTARSHYSNVSETKYSTQRSLSTIGTQRSRRQSNISVREDRSIRRNYDDDHLPPIPPRRSVSVQNPSDC